MPRTVYSNKFNCPIADCKRPHVRGADLERHAKRHHGIQVAASLLVEACSFCQTPCKSIVRLQSHESKCQGVNYAREGCESQDTLIQQQQQQQPYVPEKTLYAKDRLNEKGLDNLQRQVNSMQAEIDALKTEFKAEIKKQMESAQKLGNELRRDRVRLWVLSQKNNENS